VTSSAPARAEVVVDLDAIAANTALLRERVGRPLMAVVKADGYGHGLVPSARAVLAGGADQLGVAVLEEALALRAAGIAAPILAWLHAPGADFAAALAADVEVSVNAEWSLTEVVEAARTTGRTARLHLFADTGLSREGCTIADWPALVAEAAQAQAEGSVQVVGLWSHMAYADAPTHPTIGRQVQVFEEAVGIARAAGLNDARLHLANSAATVALPDTWYDMVRPGVALYGLDPLGGPDPHAHGLRPAMTVRAAAALTKRVPAGVGVSYGHTYFPDRETTLLLVPVGYADGVPRAAGNRAPVLAAGAHRTIAGRVCMDQFVLDVGDAVVAPGDPVVLWGPGDDGEPTAQQWADVLDTIHYELVTRVGGRFTRRYVGSAGAV
jgi:alanine racemase